MLNLKSRMVKQILRYFIFNKEEAFVTQLADSLNADISNLRKTLVKMEGEGVLQSHYRGRERYFSLNEDNPLLDSYKQIIKSSFGLDSLLCESFLGVNSIQKVYLYGSFAKNEYDSESDVDLLILGSVKRKDILHIVRDIEKQIGREVSFSIFTDQEFKQSRQSDQFLQEVFNGIYREII